MPKDGLIAKTKAHSRQEAKEEKKRVVSVGMMVVTMEVNKLKGKKNFSSHPVSRRLFW